MSTETVPADQLRAAQAATPSLLRQWMADPALYRRAKEEARRLAPARFPHLFDADLIQRMSITDVVVGEDEEPVRRKVKPTPVARQAAMPPTLAPRLICRDAAAAYVGISPNTFDKMIAEGLMPNPRRLSERRLAWDVRQLDTAIDRLPIDGVVDGNADTDDTTDHSWDDIDAQAQIKPVAH